MKAMYIIRNERLIRIIVVAVLFLILITLNGVLNAQSLKMGILTDYKQSAELDSIFNTIVEEVNQLSQPKANYALNGEVSYENNTLASASESYDALSAKNDLVILFGSVSIKGSIRPDAMPVKTIGVGLIDPYLQGIPYENGKSGLPNFTYVWSVQDIKTEITEFQRITPFNNLLILVNDQTAPTFREEQSQKYFEDLKKQLNLNINVAYVGNDISSIDHDISNEYDAVYLSNLDGKSKEDIQHIAQILKDKQIPSFTGSQWHLENGIMASVADRNDLDQVIRKLAITVDECLNGKPLADVGVKINFKDDLYINARTAKAINLTPSFDVIFTANFINDIEQLPTYSLEEVMERAMQNNFRIKITKQDISLSEQDIKAAISNYLPNLNAGLNGVQMNPETTFALFDMPERKVSAQLGLDQLIYSEQAIAGIKISKYLNKAQAFATQAEIQQVLMNTYLDYFGVLGAKTVLNIEKENLEALKIHLELSRLGVNLGSKDRSDVLRWESEVARATQTVVKATTNLINAKYRLNTSLANSLEDEFDIKDIKMDDKVYNQFRNNPIAEFIDNPNDLMKISSFLVDEAINNNPNKQALMQQINAVNRKNTMNKRMFYTPNVALQAQMQHVLHRGGRNSNMEFAGQKLDIPNNTWNVGVGISYPIFAAKTRKINKQRTGIELQQLNNSRMELDQNMALAVRTSVSNTIASTTNIEYSGISSDNAQANYELIKEKYETGEVSITQLIDAQQNALMAKQRYSVAIYDYMQSQLQLELSIGFFSMFSTEKENEEFESRYKLYMNN